MGLNTYDARCAALKEAGIALWDVLHECRRKGSLDMAIEHDSAVTNDLADFIATHTALRHIFFNGAAAEKAFRRLAIPDVARREITTTRLPSTSPAYAGIAPATRLAQWSAIVNAQEHRQPPAGSNATTADLRDT